MPTSVNIGEAAKLSRGPANLTGRLLAGNALWNIAGSATPLLIGLFAMPILINSLGTDRFGVLSLAWTLIGYFSLFDLGLGRALTRDVSAKLGTGKTEEIPSAFWTALGLLVTLGTIAALIVSGFAPWLSRYVLRVPAALQHETVLTIYWIAAAIPIVTVSSGLRGFLEAHQSFRKVNVVRMLMGSLGFLGPVAALSFSHQLYAVVMMLSLTRVVGAAAYWNFCFRLAPELCRSRLGHGRSFSTLMRFGGWITVDNIISPLMTTMDRFFVSSLLTISVVAYYSTPNDLISRVLLVPIGMQSVIFSAFSRMSDRNVQQAERLYHKAIDAILLFIFPVSIIGILFAEDGLKLWLGAAFALHSTRVLQIFCVGILFNAITHVPSAFLQSIGHPEYNVRIHLIEFPIYCCCALFLIERLGLQGAALAWLIRVIVDTTLFFYFSHRWIPGFPIPISRLLTVTATLVFALFLSSTSPGVSSRCIVASGVLLFTLCAGFPVFSQVFQIRRRELC